MIKCEHDVNFDAIPSKIIAHSRTKRNGEKPSKSADNGRKHGSFGTQKLITINIKGTDDSRIDESETIRRTGKKIVDHNNTNTKMETMRTGRRWQAHIDFHSMLSAHVYLSFNGATTFVECSGGMVALFIFCYNIFARAFAQRCTVICACGVWTQFLLNYVGTVSLCPPTAAAAKLFSHYDFARRRFVSPHLVSYAANAGRAQQEINHQAKSLAQSNLLHIKLHCTASEPHHSNEKQFDFYLHHDDFAPT